MPHRKKKELRRTIAELENPYPSDYLILSYSDFLKVREHLAYYQFNPVVFEKLAALTNNIWGTSKRISRLSLLRTMKQYLYQNASADYYSRASKPNISLNADTRTTLFQLFKKTFEDANYLTPAQLPEARTICNGLLLNESLSSVEEEWLCANVAVSELILNRLLRYPSRSAIISSWATNNSDNNIIRGRRAEHLSWIIDEQPEFEIDKATLIHDFEHLNQQDLLAIQKFNDEVAANKIMEAELSEFLPKKIVDDVWDPTNSHEEVALTIPELNLSKRPYIPDVKSVAAMWMEDVRNFDEIRTNFFANLSTHHQLTMIWAIAYSRLDNTVKCALSKKYYNTVTHYSMYRAAKKTSNVELLKWMLDQLP